MEAMNTGQSSILGNISLESVVDDSSHEIRTSVIACPERWSLTHMVKEEPEEWEQGRGRGDGESGGGGQTTSFPPASNRREGV